MKLDPLFTVKNNQLFSISDEKQIAFSSLKKITIKWSEVELEPEAYNEEYLASLRDQLKLMDDNGTFAVLIPQIDKPLENAEQKELFINAYNHTARRIKDCVSVTGYELPIELLKEGFSADSFAQNFMDTIAIKHAQYVYFASSKNIEACRLTDSISDKAIVIY